MLVGALLALFVQVDLGAVRLERLRLAAEDGRVVAARLWRPLAATAATPAPGVLLLHGSGRDAIAMTPLAMELARRGYVVLAVDRRGHGGSPARGEGAAPGAADLGAAAPGAAAPGAGDEIAAVTGVEALRSLTGVDEARLAIVAHGTGADGLLATAARVAPRAVVLLGATDRVAEAAALPNVALVVGRFDERAVAALGRPASEVTRVPAVRALFGGVPQVVPREIYGDLAEGTGRVLHTPPLTHQGLLASGEAVAPVVDWLQRTASVGVPRAPNDQLWILWALGSALVLAGFVLALFGVAGALLMTTTFAPLRQRPAPAVGLRGVGWWLVGVAVAAVPALTFAWAVEHTGTLVPPSRLLPQPATTGIVGWALLNAALFLVVLLTWHLVVGRRRGATAASYGVTAPGGGRAVGFAVAVVAAAYGALGLVAALFAVDGRLGVLALPAISPAALWVAAVVAAPLAVALALAGTLLHGLLRPLGTVREGIDGAIANTIVATGGLVVLLALQYAAILRDAPPPLPSEIGTLALALAPALGIAALLSTYLFVRTGSVWPGALVNALWLAGYLAAGGVWVV
jgi:hypothetical protein